jgi:hypothetical protein
MNALWLTPVSHFSSSAKQKTFLCFINENVSGVVINGGLKDYLALQISNNLSANMQKHSPFLLFLFFCFAVSV